MDVSIITLQNINNYGSMLQAIATQKLFEECNLNVEIVNYTRKDAKFWESIYDYIKNDSFLLKLAKIAILVPTKIRFARIWKKSSKKYLSISKKRYYSIYDFNTNPIRADYYCVGSDQVWNSSWNKGILPEFYLTYANGGNKFSFCSSIGKSELDEQEKTITKDYLQSFSALSVREQSAVDILNDLGFDNVKLLLDPTLLLEKSCWIKMFNKRVEHSHYLLVYQLNKNKDFDNYVRQYAKKHKLKLVRIGIRLDQIIKNGKVYALPDIESFLSLFYYADFIITDSFHATAFSLIFNKPFLVIYPNRFSSRLESILKLTRTEDRLVVDYSNLNYGESKIDYTYINDFIKIKREEALDYIKVVTSND